MSQFLPVQVTVTPPPRGDGAQSSVNFNAQFMRASFAWGSAPGRATLVYVGQAPLTRGAQAVLRIGGMYFAGICDSDKERRSASGNTRVLEFADFRDYLTWDYTYCAFNKEEVRLVNGVRRKRYWHLTPNNFNAGIKTWTDAPYLAWEILQMILQGPTVGSPWSWDLTGGGLFPTGVMNLPLYDFDAQGGKRLDAALNEISAATGTVFTLVSAPQNLYLLRWTRKGYGVLPAFAANSDDREYGEKLSGNPTNVRVLGDRNRYQVMDVPLIKDWAAAWEQFLVVEAFAEDIYQRGTDPVTGIRYNATPADPEQFIGRNKALDRALRITVREYVALRNSQAAGSGDPFADQRKYAGRSRMDMPAALYLQTLVFRAFRPSFTQLVNYDGRSVPLESLELTDQLLCRVSHHLTTGALTAHTGEPADSNGYAITKGYQVGAELFRQIKPDQFDINVFSTTSPTRLWQTAAYQIDASGEGDRFVIFDAPLFVSDNLMARVDGMAVVNAGFTLQTPEVKAALVFAAEPFTRWFGTWPNVSRDTVAHEPSLRAEYVLQNGVYTEVLYADNESAADKAYQIANLTLNRQYVYATGGNRLVWHPSMPSSDFRVDLTSLIDRVDIESGPNGTWATWDLTSERGPDSFQPERDLDRRSMEASLFPGQRELIVQAEAAARLAQGFKQMPQQLTDRLVKFLRGGPSDAPLIRVDISSGTGTLPVGTPLWKAGTTIAAQNTNTRAVMPAAVTTTHQVFAGVTVRQNEPANRPLYTAVSGLVLARVLGPVSVGDVVGWVAGQSYLGKDGDPAVGKAQQAIAGGTVQLIYVLLGSGGGAGTPAEVTRYRIKAFFGDYMVCREWNGVADGATDVYVAKPTKLRNSITSAVVDGVTINYTYDSTTVRRSARATVYADQIHTIVPRYNVNDIIHAVECATGVNTTGAAPVPVTNVDLNIDARAWALVWT